jgi:hypothetical protein
MILQIFTADLGVVWNKRHSPTFGTVADAGKAADIVCVKRNQTERNEANGRTDQRRTHERDRMSRTQTNE